VVHDPPRRTDYHLRSAAQHLDLFAETLTAVHGQHPQARHAGPVAAAGFRHLLRQFPGRRQYQHLNLGSPGIDPGQQRQCEGSGLAGTGLRLTEHVAAPEQVRDDPRLDG
jgi:hypothetical protein